MALPLSVCETTQQVEFVFVPEALPPFQDCGVCEIPAEKFDPIPLELICSCPTESERWVGEELNFSCVPTKTQTTERHMLDNLVTLVKNKYCMTQ